MKAKINRGFLERAIMYLRGIAEETHVFRNAEDYRQYLVKSGISDPFLADIMEHEGEHFKEAIARGYDAIYVLSTQRKKTPRGYTETHQPGVLPLGNVTLEDNLAITCAPKKLSSGDESDRRRYSAKLIISIVHQSEKLYHYKK